MDDDRRSLMRKKSVYSKKAVQTVKNYAIDTPPLTGIE